jgi:hypothetical protein
LDALALGARIVLAAVLVFAAIAKLRDRKRVVEQMADFVGRRAAPLASVAVPGVELALAIALLAVPQQAWPGWLAAALLLVFTGVLVRAEVRHVPCPCFGTSSSARPVGSLAIIRNGVLLALAVIATG